MSEQHPFTIFTIGHSNHSIEHFVELLEGAGITAIADVRSSPYSRFCPQFNREALKESLSFVGIAYIPMGAEFGARRTEPESLEAGKVVFEKVAKTKSFQSGVERLVKGVADHQVALMCSEKDPIDCHRTVLVARNLSLNGFDVQHILEDGKFESMDSVSNRIMKVSKVNTEDLFIPKDVRLVEAYRIRGEKISWEESSNTSETEVI